MRILKVRLLFQKLRHKAKKTSVFHWIRRQKFFLPLYHYLYKRGMIIHCIDKNMLKKLIKKDAPVIVEIGAYDGKDTVELLQIFPHATIFCFEPDPRNVSSLKAKLGDDKRVHLFQAAISDRSTDCEFYLSEGSDRINQYGGSSSIKKPYRHLEFFPACKFNQCITVKCLELDRWSFDNQLDEIDLLWADVQGAEREMISGGMRTLNKLTRFIYTEYSNDKLYYGQPTLEEILSMLPKYELLGLYGNNVLLRNKALQI